MSWTYDPFGNRLSQNSGGAAQVAMPSPSTASYTAASNQMTAYNGYALAYDAAGDVTQDALNSYLYDAEGRICAVKTAGPSYTGYIYDAAGTRVAKGSLTSFSCNFATNGFKANTSWVLGPGGEQVTEYSVTGTPGSYVSTWQHTNAFSGGHITATYHDSGTYFYLADWLGSKRVELGANGCATAYASLPYGDGLTTVALPGFTACAADATEHHFTGKERDAESGNDYFGARYYASSMGRWLSPDADFTLRRILPNPQKWNRYAYVHNNPLVYFDPDGMADFRIFDNYSDKDLPSGGRPNWGALAAAARKNGHTVEIYNVASGNATQANMNAALHSQGTNVLSIGHNVLSPSSFNAIGIMLGNGTFMGQGTGPDNAPMMSFSNITASSVTILGCSSFDLGGQFPTTTFTGIQDTTDHMSNSLTDEQAGAAWLTSASSLPANQPVDLAAAAAAANNVVTHSTNTVSVPGDKPVNVDKGDKVVERKQ